MTTLKIGIASYEEMKARTLAVARGKLRVACNEPKVWFVGDKKGWTARDQPREGGKKAVDPIDTLCVQVARRRRNETVVVEEQHRDGRSDVPFNGRGTIVPEPLPAVARHHAACEGGPDPDRDGFNQAAVIEVDGIDGAQKIRRQVIERFIRQRGNCRYRKGVT
jgi:hypothetical protein